MKRNAFIIQVNQEDFARSQAFTSERFTPLAVALRRIFPNAEIKVGSNFVSLNNLIYFVDYNWEDDKLNRRMIAKIQQAKMGIGITTEEYEIFNSTE